jgi:hypothetical protein
MASSHWQKQNSNIRNIVRVVALVIAILLSILFVSLGLLGIAQTSLLFLALFMATEVILAFILKNRYANSMVRVLKFDYEEIERDFRLVFKEKHIRFYRRSEEDAYRYEFPGHSLNMTVQPHWVQRDPNSQPVTKVTLYELSAKNEAFAEMLAEAIDEMANQRADDEAS